MKLLLHPYPALHPLARLRVWHRLLAALAVGAVIAFALPAALWETRLLGGWLGGSLSYLGVVWIGVGRLDAKHTRLRAASYDPGTATFSGLRRSGNATRHPSPAGVRF